jgi:hypothetical protein
MSALEDRIRTGLNADRRVPDLLDAVYEGAHRRRARRTAAGAAAAALAVGAVATGIALLVGGDERSAPDPAPQPSRTERPDDGLGARDYPALVQAGGDALLVTTESTCPTLPRTICRSWWRFDGEAWSSSGMPPDRPEWERGWVWLPNGREAVWPPGPGRPALATRDGGQSWKEIAFPPACLEQRHDCQLTATATAAFITDWYVDHPVKLYRADAALDSWRPVEVPAGAELFTMVGNGIVGVDSPHATRFWVSRDDGDTWSSTSPPCDNGFLHGDSYWDGIVAECPDLGESEILRSGDLTTWDRLGTHLEPFRGGQGARYPVYLSDEAVIVGGEGGPTLLTPSGSARVALPAGTRFQYNVTRVGSTYYALAHSGATEPWTQEVIRSDDGGRTWTVLIGPVQQPARTTPSDG